jgi:hypothetical protein
MSRVAAALVCALALAGCAGFGSLPGSASAREERESRQVLDLIRYVQKVASLPADEQLREVNASSQTFSKDRGAYWRVRLALLLSLPGTGFADDAKAAGLLEPLASAEGAGPMQQFAGLLHAQIGERLREQRRAAQFKEQLDALKDIERKIIEREQTRPK